MMAQAQVRRCPEYDDGTRCVLCFVATLDKVHGDHYYGLYHAMDDG